MISIGYKTGLWCNLLKCNGLWQMVNIMFIIRRNLCYQSYLLSTGGIRLFISIGAWYSLELGKNRVFLEFWSDPPYPGFVGRLPPRQGTPANFLKKVDSRMILRFYLLYIGLFFFAIFLFTAQLLSNWEVNCQPSILLLPILIILICLTVLIMRH